MPERSSAFLGLMLLLFLQSGCARKESPQVADAGDAGASMRPVSGGEMVCLAGGEFTMGDSRGLEDETPPHQVFVSSFYMDKCPVSQKLYEKVLGANPSKRKYPNNPVERVQWTDAVRFCNRCSELDGLTPCYDLETWQCDFEANGYRLPTEAEWEYACLAGSRTRYCFGDDEARLAKYAWFRPRSRGRPQPVGKKLPNAWGLYDVHGNVWEWCNDYYNAAYYRQSPSENPRGPLSGKKRVLRGGAWSSNADACRAAYRFSEFPMFSDACFGSDSYGFRRVKNGQVPARTTTAAIDNGENAPPKRQDPTEASPRRTVVPDQGPDVEQKIGPDRLQGTIVFVSDRTGSLDVWKMKADGSERTQLTRDEAADADPRFSPADERIMYTSLRDGFPQIWMIGLDGSDPTLVTDGSQAQWSPDGRSIVFVRDNQVHVRALETGAERRVTPRGWQRCGVPAWSPDGKQIAVASRHLGTMGIFILSIDGQDRQQVETEDPCCTPQWSSDGTRMLFQTNKGHIHQIRTDNGTEEQVTFGADIQHDARFSPDGSMIVFARGPTEQGPWQLWITDLESDDLDSIQITRDGSNRLPDWHPIQ